MLPELIPKILLSSWDLNLISSNGFSLMYFEGFTVKGLGLQGGRMLHLSWVSRPMKRWSMQCMFCFCIYEVLQMMKNLWLPYLCCTLIYW
ncbi:uncharacterized protein LOC115666721 isoform X2 [Syzygium oleosum]|uniref:uncharacterized protein LOC115666721 isoform X2 n=1 Tax=Syzygium oleosum TaxID=219896 RepID=UPI0024B9DA19|nr:uncharacterized protein LOC115666721 isoform X2 [Syzygium oleosum]